MRQACFTQGTDRERTRRVDRLLACRRLLMLLGGLLIIVGYGVKPGEAQTTAQGTKAPPAGVGNAKAPPRSGVNPQGEPAGNLARPREKAPVGRPRILGDLIGPMNDPRPSPLLNRKPITAEAAAAAGLRRLTSKHLTLYTDVPSSAAVDELPRVFDLAIAPWCEYFRVDPASVSSWQVTAYLMRDADRFRRIQAFPEGVPPFKNGFQWGDEFWWYDQPSEYYRRHLLLHEGTHAFMHRWLGGTGPPWYTEGMAELLGTHRWSDGQLTLRYSPRSPEEAPDWGRIKIVQDDFEAGRGRSLEGVFQIELREILQVETYGWSWAATYFLDSHPRSQSAFREMTRDAREGGPPFTQKLMRQLADVWQDLSEDWQLFVAQAEYGYDVARASIQRRPATPLEMPEVRLKISPAAGWQSTGIQLQADTTYEVAAVGRYQIVPGPPIWWCEPGGVTIRYYRGQPLGILQGVVQGENRTLDRLSPFATPQSIGRKLEMSPSQPGTLYLRVNESAADLGDNSGELLVRIRRIDR